MQKIVVYVRCNKFCEQVRKARQFFASTLCSLHSAHQFDRTLEQGQERMFLNTV